MYHNPSVKRRQNLGMSKGLQKDVIKSIVEHIEVSEDTWEKLELHLGLDVLR